MFGRPKVPPEHHPDPLIDSQIQHIRTLRGLAASCQKQMDHCQKTIDSANRKRTMRGLDGISSEAYEDIMRHTEKKLPEIRKEMNGYQQQADDMIAALNINDRAYVS